MPRRRATFPVIDLFAGPGGLGEGFSSFSPDLAPDHHPFDVALSIEKDPIACQTLLLRKFFRAFPEPPPEYRRYLADPVRMPLAKLYELYSDKHRFAQSRTWQVELGKEPSSSLKRRIEESLKGSKHWVLVGGPPCQAYSLVGRSRMRSTNPDFENDERHFLYREYLRIVAEHKPPVFLMENVKGLLSATLGGKKILDRILEDLQWPGRALDMPGRSRLKYRLHSLVEPAEPRLIPQPTDRLDPRSLVVRAEEYGIPQARHRIFILGIRSDIEITPGHLNKLRTVNIEQVISDLPPIRSKLSKSTDSFEGWSSVLKSIRRQQWTKHRTPGSLSRTTEALLEVLSSLDESAPSIGRRWSAYRSAPRAYADWYRHNAEGLSLHEARGHMESDLHRYLFAASFAQANGNSAPTLRDFPEELLPDHTNASAGKDGTMFADRFRVQTKGHPSTTVTSHISKDGHYFIHYDPRQCRSLSVREAARLQTFPDSYFFEGPRTEQYRQVGNAVPPLLARQIAAIVHAVLAQLR